MFIQTLNMRTRDKKENEGLVTRRLQGEPMKHMKRDRKQPRWKSPGLNGSPHSSSLATLPPKLGEWEKCCRPVPSRVQGPIDNYEPAL